MAFTGLDSFVSRESGGTTRRYLTDALGSTLGLSDNSGTVANYTYEPFGRTYISGNDAGNPYRYTGREDDGTGLYFSRARYYSPALRRFLSEDPIGFAGGTNLHANVGNQPTALTDPMSTKPSSSRDPQSCFSNSFTPDTQVRMADGTNKRISEVKPGDQVLATDPLNGRTATQRVHNLTVDDLHTFYVSTSSARDSSDVLTHNSNSKQGASGCGLGGWYGSLAPAGQG
ncbi:RHS repeat-associated core domain-containing protein [Streptoalloteichus tenebrarius]|uniref:RHS repeat-associated core domain-containing protein n=1 Tax=Streptoalloteichus tenebrarius (strain ATCC 17920 / DSM 40477 / JCM 4838 / CBS 697.72 / NBRC 16177 / NCIMB 11028 / NRRL B-12390 / A12253. 1 / ISP 5477) TaxID=1933 RepID=UPI0020A4D94B|nr:RHS repeat-associated core domain-containing protein [Streptoalloteichus tenebrarius]BFE98387.1 hypothetical protein GCM10020241_00630 [Streptoalloteichus tenebrarius]